MFVNPKSGPPVCGTFLIKIFALEIIIDEEFIRAPSCFCKVEGVS